MIDFHVWKKNQDKLRESKQSKKYFVSKYQQKDYYTKRDQLMIFDLKPLNQFQKRWDGTKLLIVARQDKINKLHWGLWTPVIPTTFMP